MKPRDVMGAVFGPWPPRRIFAVAAGAVAVPAIAVAELSCLAAPNVIGALAWVGRALRMRWAIGHLPREELRLLAFCVHRRYGFIWVYGDEKGALRLCRKGLLAPSGHRAYFVHDKVWPHVDACLKVHPELEKLADECRAEDDADTEARVPRRQA
ncbi:MAG: hypothetical protein ACYTKD_04235 [Planctomycetota bacterium]|jgi:hypothetical protein